MHRREPAAAAAGAVEPRAASWGRGWKSSSRLGWGVPWISSSSALTACLLIAATYGRGASLDLRADGSALVPIEGPTFQVWRLR